MRYTKFEDREHVGSCQHDDAVRREMTVRSVEEHAGTRKVLDHLAGEDHAEDATEIHVLGVTGDDREPFGTRACRQLLVELDTDCVGCDARDHCVHPIRTVDTGTGTDVQHRGALDIAADSRETFLVRTPTPLLLQWMSPGHGCVPYDPAPA